MAVNTWAKDNIGGSSKTGASGSESSGGGGSGDFSLAKVNVDYETGGARLIAPNIYEDDEYYMLTVAESGEYKIPLYHGHGMAEISDKQALVNVVTSGDITYFEEEMVFMISGDGSITISLPED